MGNEKKIAKKQAETVTISRAEYEELKFQNQWLLDQLGLTFNELEAYAFGTKSATPEQIAVKAHERKRQSGNVLEVVPEGTPTEVVEHRLPEEELACKACGSQMEEIGKKVRRTLQMKPAKFWIREDVYYTYACKNCERETGEANILNMPKKPALLPGRPCPTGF